uniref:Uncharacterized protein n=1 Tax=Anguilla anguilla TaxID=7936 RepID=A0A0E9SXY8_ANGAN
MNCTHIVFTFIIGLKYYSHSCPLLFARINSTAEKPSIETLH